MHDHLRRVVFCAGRPDAGVSSDVSDQTSSFQKADTICDDDLLDVVLVSPLVDFERTETRKTFP